MRAGRVFGGVVDPDLDQGLARWLTAMFEYLQSLREHLDENWGKDRGISVNF